MSLINNKWIETNDGKLYRTTDLTNFRYEKPHYCVELTASNKKTGTDVYIDFIDCSGLAKESFSVRNHHLVKKIMESERK